MPKVGDFESNQYQFKVPFLKRLYQELNTLPVLYEASEEIESHMAVSKSISENEDRINTGIFSDRISINDNTNSLHFSSCSFNKNYVACITTSDKILRLNKERDSVIITSPAITKNVNSYPYNKSIYQKFIKPSMIHESSIPNYIKLKTFWNNLSILSINNLDNLIITKVYLTFSMNNLYFSKMVTLCKFKSDQTSKVRLSKDLNEQTPHFFNLLPVTRRRFNSIDKNSNAFLNSELERNTTYGRKINEHTKSSVTCIDIDNHDTDIDCNPFYRSENIYDTSVVLSCVVCKDSKFGLFEKGSLCQNNEEMSITDGAELDISNSTYQYYQNECIMYGYRNNNSKADKNNSVSCSSDISIETLPNPLDSSCKVVGVKLKTPKLPVLDAYSAVVLNFEDRIEESNKSLSEEVKDREDDDVDENDFELMYNHPHLTRNMLYPVSHSNVSHVPLDVPFYVALGANCKDCGEEINFYMKYLYGLKTISQMFSSLFSLLEKDNDEHARFDEVIDFEIYRLTYPVDRNFSWVCVHRTKKENCTNSNVINQPSYNERHSDLNVSVKWWYKKYEDIVSSIKNQTVQLNSKNIYNDKIISKKRTRSMSKYIKSAKSRVRKSILEAIKNPSKTFKRGADSKIGSDNNKFETRIKNIVGHNNPQISNDVDISTKTTKSRRRDKLYNPIKDKRSTFRYSVDREDQRIRFEKRSSYNRLQSYNFVLIKGIWMDFSSETYL